MEITLYNSTIPYGSLWNDHPPKKNIKITGTSGFKLCISAQKSGGFPKSLVSVLKLAWRFRAETHLAWLSASVGLPKYRSTPKKDAEKCDIRKGTR